MEFSPEGKPLKCADGAIHCGDPTNGFRLDEHRTAISQTKDIHVPLRLVIAHN